MRSITATCGNCQGYFTAEANETHNVSEDGYGALFDLQCPHCKTWYYWGEHIGGWWTPARCELRFENGCGPIAVTCSQCNTEMRSYMVDLEPGGQAFKGSQDLVMRPVIKCRGCNTVYHFDRKAWVHVKPLRGISKLHFREVEWNVPGVPEKMRLEEEKESEVGEWNDDE